MQLTTHEEDLVTQTFAAIASDLERATDIFYHRLFEVMPETQPMFLSEKQRGEMFHILATAVKSLSFTQHAGPDLHELGQRHRVYGVKQEQFEGLGEVLIWTFEQMLGKGFKPEARVAWQKVYTALKDSVTENLYDDTGGG